MNQHTRWRNANPTCLTRRPGATAVLAALLLASPVLPVAAAPGDPDPSFGSGGNVLIDLGFFSGASAVAVQSNGKIIAAGSCLRFPPGGGQGFFVLCLARLTTNGSLDSSFGGGGIVETEIAPGTPLFARAVAVQRDGKIVVAGSVGDLDSDFVLVRYRSDGSLDTTFGDGGIVATDFFGGADGASSIAIQANGKLVVAGFAKKTSGSNRSADFALARYNTNGSLDTGFSGDGKATVGFFGFDDFANGLAIQRNGKIVIAGYAAKNADHTDGNFALARYETNGTLDRTFSGDGKLTTDFFGGDDGASSIAIQANGKLVVAGFAKNTSGNRSYDFALARYNRSGSLDTGFSGDGKATVGFLGFNDFASDLAIQRDGKIIVVGAADRGPSPFDILHFPPALARYKSNGTLDAGFGRGGKVVNGGACGAAGVALQGDGKIVTAGPDCDTENLFGFSVWRNLK